MNKLRNIRNVIIGTVGLVTVLASPLIVTSAASASTPSFGITKAHVSPQTIAAGATTTIYGQVYNTGTNSGPVTVDFEIHDASNNKVFQQFYTKQTFAANARHDYTTAWHAAGSGTYTAQYGVYASDWSQTYVYGTIGSVTVTGAAAPSFIATKVHASPQPASVNTPVYLYSELINNSTSATGPLMVDFKVNNANNKTVFQKSYPNQFFTANGRNDYNGIPWTPTKAGTYTMQYGVYSSDRSQVYTYNANVAVITVN